MLKKAILFMVFSTISFALLNLLVKHLKGFNAYELVFFRSLGSLFFTFPFLIKNKLPILGNNQKMLIGRSVVGFLAMSFFFLAIHNLPMATAVSIRYTAPIFAAFFAIFILKEKLYALQVLFFIISFLGVIILKGFQTDISLLGLLFALLSAILTGLVFIYIRKIGKSEHPVVVVNYFMVVSTILGGLMSIFNWKTPQGIEWLWMSAMGIVGYFGQYFMTKALQIVESNKITPFYYLEVIFTLLLGLFFINESYTWISVLGISLILIGLILNVLYKKSKP